MNENKALLLQHGWHFTGACNCSGFITYKFTLQSITGEFKISLTKGHFKIKPPHLKKFTRYPISELKNFIDEIFSTHKITVS